MSLFPVSLGIMQMVYETPVTSCSVGDDEPFDHSLSKIDDSIT